MARKPRGGLHAGRKLARRAATPGSEAARSGGPAPHDGETVVWSFAAADLDGDWGWRATAARDWWEGILPKLQHFESMTWSELLRASGGRSRGNNHHAVKVENLTAQAKKRLREIDADDAEELFSLRLAATTRIYGFRDGRALRLLWYDPWHGDNARAVYPVRAR